MLELLSDIYEWFTTGIYEFAVELVAYLVEWIVVGMITAKLWAAVFFWDVAKTILVNVGLSPMIEASWASLDSRLLGHLTFFKIPEAINILLQAIVTRFSMRVMGL